MARQQTLARGCAGGVSGPRRLSTDDRAGGAKMLRCQSCAKKSFASCI